MRLAVFGGTGRVGRRILEYAVAKGHSVRALVRDPGKLSFTGPEVAAIQGDATDSTAVMAVLDGSDAVLSALGGGGLAMPGMILSAGMRNIVAGMQKREMRRVLAVAGSGVLDNPRGGLRSETGDFPEIFQAINREHHGTWDALRGSNLDWTLVCCPDLVDGMLTLSYRTTPNLLPEGGAMISVEDVADFMVQQVANGGYVRQRVGVAY